LSRGLVVGKFMPLHRGHQFLIDSALAEVDDLTIVVYDSPGVKFTDRLPEMPLKQRVKWIADLYPNVENIVPRHDILPDVDPKVKDDPAYAIDYARDLDFLGSFDYVFSSESYGEPFANALDATHVEVDAARTLVPISGTAIREDLFNHRGYLHPLVYRSLIQKVVFVGTESTGKTTLARAMAKEMNTRWVHEYGRELWEQQGGTGSFADLLKIGKTQLRREEAAALQSREYLFCDTNAWTTLQWSMMYHGTADARLYELAEQTKDDYIWIICANDFDWVDDGTRELKDRRSFEFQTQNMKALKDMGIKPYPVYGSVENRIHEVKKILQFRENYIPLPGIPGHFAGVA
jgi:HTH-type transcriptional repressor of NAD biosynthesis genes